MMENWSEFSDGFGEVIRQTWAVNRSWRFVAALVTLICAILILDIFWRKLSRWIGNNAQAKGFVGDAWKMPLVGVPVRILALVIALKIAELILKIPDQLRSLLWSLEAVLIAFAFLVFAFQVVNLIDGVRLLLPDELRDRVPEETVRKLKGVIRVGFLVGVLSWFIYSQRALLPEWLWEQKWWRYVLILAIVAVVTYGARLIDRFLRSVADAMQDLEEKTRFRLILSATIWPVRLLFVAIAVFCVRAILPLPPTLSRVVQSGEGVFTTLAVILFLYQIMNLLVFELQKVSKREDNLMDETFVYLIRTMARVLIVAVGAVYLLQAVSGKPMSTLIAGLGIGGLAVALAAQDTLKNFFGSIMIMLDKPFQVGQRVVADGYDGVVEDIGFRSTRVRTLTGHQVTIPNEKMASVSVENIGRRPSIRRLTNITITYDTPLEKVQKAVAIIREILENHEGMNPDFPPRVYFNEFNDASLNILMIYWYFPPDYWAFTDFAEGVNLRIMRAFEEEGIEFAFPTTTTYLAHDPRRPLHIDITGKNNRGKSGLEDD